MNRLALIVIVALCALCATLNCKKDSPSSPQQQNPPATNLGVDKDSLLFGDTTRTLTFTITNRGTELLTWGLTPVTDNGLPWITRAWPASGSLAANGTEVVGVDVQRSGLPTGTCGGWIKISSSAGRDSVRVVMCIPPDFLDDFSQGDGRWTFGGCTHSIANNQLTMVSNATSQAYAYSDTFSPYLNIPWLYRGEMTIVTGSTLTTDNGISLGIDDIGAYAVQHLWLSVRRNSTTRNWIWLWWVPSLTTQWLPYDSTCYGTSGVISTEGMKNTLEMSVTSDERFTLKANGYILAQNNNSVNNFESLASIDVTLGARFLTLRGGSGTTTTWDNILFDSETTPLLKLPPVRVVIPPGDSYVNELFKKIEQGEDVTLRTLLEKRIRTKN